MSWATVRRDIEKRLEDNWGTTVIAYDNVPFTPPQDAPWVRLRILDEATGRITINRPATHRARGNVVVEIFVLKNTGTQTLRSYADTIAALFRDAQFSGLVFREANLSIQGDFEGWFKGTLLMPFHWDGVY